MNRLFFWLAAAVVAPATLLAADLTAIVDNTSYNVGSEVRIRLQPGGNATATIRYAGKDQPVATAIPVSGSEYAPLWHVPWDAQTGRYEIDIAAAGGPTLRAATSFAVYRQLAKIVSVDLDKTFYTAGDPVNPRIVVQNLSNRPIANLQVEFEGYTYPWIAPAEDEPPAWRTILADSLSLRPGEQKELRVDKAAVVQSGNEPVNIYFAAVIRDSRDPDHIYDLAFPLPAFTRPPNTFGPKQYPFLYLYPRAGDVPKSETYRHFYPAQFVSPSIRFNTEHTMFNTGAAPSFTFDLQPPANENWSGATVHTRILDLAGKQLQEKNGGEGPSGTQSIQFKPLEPGRYFAETTIELPNGAVVARNRLEFAVNRLPRSILIFCAHEDDDTSHPALIRAAVENDIPIRFVYFTGGDAGGCDRYYMHSCDAPRAMDFGETRMQESVASLGHLGVKAGDIFFLGLPDGGMGQVWDHRSSSDPYLSVLLASDHSPYRNAAIPNLPYARDAVVAGIKDYILRYNPDLIVTGHPDERHVDHRTNNWFVVQAMQELLRDGKLSRDTHMVVDVAYGALPGKHSPYHFEKDMFYVSGEAARMGQEALWYYQTQDGNHQQANLVDYDKLPREEPYPHFRLLDWQEHAGWNEGKPPATLNH